MTWPSGRVGPGSTWPWPMTSSSTTSAAGRSSATASTPRPCSRRTRGGSPRSGGTRRRGGVGSLCDRGRKIRSFTQRRKGQAQRAQEKDGAVPPSRLCAKPVRSARVSLTMIVRDEESNLPHCLESVRGIFDEIVVVDTGSVDRTREIARGFGAQVFEFAWVDDFAAARNVALSHATGDYAFWLDADDVVDPPEREKLRALLDGLVCPNSLREGEAPSEPHLAPARAEPRPPGSCRIRGALRLRPQPRRQRRRDRRRSRPALPAPRRRPLDLSRPRADHAGPATGQYPGALDRPGRPSYRVCRSRPPRP